MIVSKNIEFKHFLTEAFNISYSDFSMAQRAGRLEETLLAMTLWSYGMLDLEQLEQSFAWLQLYDVCLFVVDLKCRILD